MRRSAAMLALLVLLGTGAAAFACTNISTLNISDSSGRPGKQVRITGSSFGNSSPSGRRTPSPLPVRIHWNGTEGPLLGEAFPDAVGNISASVIIPDAPPGHYVVFGVQQDSDGYHMYGTPARVAFEILTPDGRSATPADRAVDQAPAGQAGSWKIPGLLVGLGLLGGALLVAGFIASLRVLAPGRLAQPGRVSPEQ